jgi:subtilisin family serine protease
MLVPAGLVAVALLGAACAPPPAPASSAPLLPACAGANVAAAAAPPAVDTATNTAAEVVVVAVDDAGRPQIVTTDADAARSTSASLESDPDLDVVAVEPDQPMSTQAVGTTGGDPYRSQQWALDDLGAENAWGTSTGDGVDIAVVDTGVTGSHPDFAGRICSGVAYLGSTGAAQLGQGTTDGNGHGTHVAGIAAAGSGDGVGIAGVAPSARLIPVRVLDAQGHGSSSDVARGITWAVDHGAEVVNLSLGGPHSVAVDTAVAYAESHGVVVVAAAGNDGPTGAANYPAALDTPIAVASYDQGGEISWFSTAGGYVDVAAPGSGIVSTYKDGRWTYMSGTSMATPHVTGTVALLLAHEPALRPAQVRARVTATAVDTGPIGHDSSFGWGWLDPVAALAG